MRQDARREPTKFLYPTESKLRSSTCSEIHKQNRVREREKESETRSRSERKRDACGERKRKRKRRLKIEDTCVSQGERFDAKKHPSFIFTLSGPKQQNNYKTHRQLDVRYPAKLLQRHDHLCTRMEDLHNKKVSEREREREMHASSVGDHNERARERKERE